MTRTREEIAEIARALSPLSHHLGMRVISASDMQVELSMTATAELLNRNGMLHGGAIMALADTAGGTATHLRLAPDEMTVTIESKTGFFRAIAPGEEVRAVTRGLHVGRRTHVWQTDILRADGKLAAQVTQTQMVMPARDKA